MLLNTPINLWLNILVSLLAYAAPAEDFVVYDTHHRLASELQKAGAGLGNGARVSMMGTKVVVYGTKAQRDAVLALFAELDHKLGNYTVRFRLAARGRGTRDAAGVGVQGGKISAGLSAGSSESQVSDEAEVLVSDGGTARLYADSGIYPKTVSVYLRSIGEHAGAHVEIRESDANSVGEQAIVTELDVPLKEWRSIGGIKRNEDQSSSRILGRAKRSTLSAEDVQIRVSPEP